MKISEIVQLMEKLAPPALQEEYDNSGLLIGEPGREIDKALVCLDITDAVLEEAVKEGAGLVISHHPLIFKGIKRLTGGDYVQKLVFRAIRENIAIYAMHTNLDNISKGVNRAIGEKLEMKNLQILRPMENLLRKLVTFCPDIKLADGTYVPDLVRKALYNSGCGHIGDYDCCSYNISGMGTFRALDHTSPFIGSKYEVTEQKEIRVETVFPAYLEQQVVKALIETHPYEEVAYDIYPLLNVHDRTGAGMIGDLPHEFTEKKFLEYVRDQLETGMLRYSPVKGNKIRKVAICGGSGAFLIRDAIHAGADAFITADLKYHDFFESEAGIFLVDAGHFETEQHTINLMYNYITENFPKFAVQKISFKTNPINYL